MRVLQIISCIVGLIGMFTIEPTIKLPANNDKLAEYVFVLKIVAYILNFLLVVLPMYYGIWKGI